MCSVLFLCVTNKVLLFLSSFTSSMDTILYLVFFLKTIPCDEQIPRFIGNCNKSRILRQLPRDSQLVRQRQFPLNHQRNHRRRYFNYISPSISYNSYCSFQSAVILVELTWFHFVSSFSFFFYYL